MSAINPKDFSIFTKDFLELMRIAYGMNDYYIKANPTAAKYMPIYKSIIRSFNKKYPSLKLRLDEGHDLKLRIFIKTIKPLKEIFLESASKIPGLKSIGSTNFGTVDISESEKLYGELEKVKDKIYITYHAEQLRSDLLCLKRRNKALELEYEPEELLDPHHSNFLFCAFYALKDGYNQKIKLFEKGLELGFVSMLSAEEFKKKLMRFNPFMNE